MPALRARYCTNFRLTKGDHPKTIFAAVQQPHAMATSSNRGLYKVDWVFTFACAVFLNSLLQAYTY
jgi:hypothetical protein